jgi:hypothetical protein
MHISHSEVSIEKVHSDLQAELGKRLVVRKEGDPDTPIAYLYPGGEHAVLIFYHDAPLGPILRIDAPVAETADWHDASLAGVLLQEGAGWMFGRVERSGDGIVIEHNLWADTPAKRLATMVVLLADTAVRLRQDLVRMGALTTMEEVA